MSDSVCVDTKQGTGGAENACAFEDDVSIEELAKTLNGFGALPQRRHHFAGTHVEFQHSLTRTHDVKASCHPQTLGAWRYSEEFQSGAHDVCIDLSPPCLWSVWHCDTFHSPSQHALISPDPPKQARIEAVALRSARGHVVQRSPEKFKGGFVGLRTIIPE